MTQKEDDDLLQAVMERYLEQLERGERINREHLLREFPQLRETLDQHLSGLDNLVELLPRKPGLGWPSSVADVLTGAPSAGTLPTQLGDFRLLRRVGSGGMGIVYEAEQQATGDRVAVKVLPLDASFQATRVRRFELEAEVGEKLTHSNIVPIISTGMENGIQYIAMKFIHGDGLDALLQLTETDVHESFFKTLAKQGAEIASALQHAHDKGVVHRDVKPGNLLIESCGKIWLTDFGLAQLHQSQTLTAPGDLLGTLAFMSPEQRAGDELDHRTDVYSLGATLQAWAEVEVRRSKQNGAPREIPADLSAIFQVATKNDRDQRYQTARSLSEDLEKFAGARKVSAHSLIRRALHADLIRRYRSAAIFTATLLALSILVFYFVSEIRSKAELSTARVAEQSKQIAELEYVQDMQTAFAQVDRPHLNRHLLDRHRPRQSELDQRGVEWHLLNNLSLPPARTVIGRHDGAANELAVTPNGCVCSVGDDGKLRYWNLDDPQENWEVEVSTEKLHAVAVSPDGKSIVTGNEIATLWNVDSRKGRKVSWHSSNVESIAFSPDGRRIAIAARYEDVRLLDRSGKLLNEVKSAARHYSIAFTTDGTQLLVPDRKKSITGATLGIVRAWDSELTKTVTEFVPTNVENGSYTHVALSDDGTFHFLAEEYDADSLCIHDAKSGDLLLVLPRHRSRVASVDVAPNGRRVAAGFRDGSIAVWNLRRNENGELTCAGEKLAIMAHRGGTHCVRFLDSERIVSCGADGQVGIWKPHVFQAFTTHPFTSTAASRIATSADRIVVPRRENLWVFDKDLRVVSCTNLREPLGVDLTSSGKVVAVGRANESRVEFLDAETGEVQISIMLQSGTRVRDVCFSPDDAELAVLTDNGRVYFLEPSRGEVSAHLSLELQSDFPVGELVYSPDGSRLVCGLAENGLYLVDVRSRRVLGVRPTSYTVESLIFLDENRFITCHMDSSIHIRELPSMAASGQFVGHNRGGVGDLDLTRDGRTLASSGNDGTIRLWHIPTRQCLGIVSREERGSDYKSARFVTFSKDGRRLFISDNRPMRVKSYKLD